MDKETVGVIIMMAVCAAVGTVAAVFLITGTSVTDVDWFAVLGWLLFLTGAFGALLEVSYRKKMKKSDRIKTSY